MSRFLVRKDNEPAPEATVRQFRTVQRGDDRVAECLNPAKVLRFTLATQVPPPPEEKP